MRIVLIGEPNVGKSSLLNHLAGRETAIVTPIPGTTRDVVRDQIQLDGMPLHITGAGLRETDDPVEQEGIRRTKLAIKEAELVILLLVLEGGNIQPIEKSDFFKKSDFFAFKMVWEFPPSCTR